MSAEYLGTANRLRDRILGMIPEHPEILTLEDAWGLFKVEGFNCDDLGPSFAQASWALAAAKDGWSKGIRIEPQSEP